MSLRTSTLLKNFLLGFLLTFVFTFSFDGSAENPYTQASPKQQRIQKALSCNPSIQCLKDINELLKQNTKEGLYQYCKVREYNAKTCCGGGACASLGANDRASAKAVL